MGSTPFRFEREVFNFFEKVEPLDWIYRLMKEYGETFKDYNILT